MGRDANRMIDRKELEQNNEAVQNLLRLAGVTQEYAMNLFNVMDVDLNGHVSRDEFEQAIRRGANPMVEATDILRVQCQLDAVKNFLRMGQQDIKNKNDQVIEALGRVESRQNQLEEKLLSVQQPDPRLLDTMS